MISPARGLPFRGADVPLAPSIAMESLRRPRPEPYVEMNPAVGWDDSIPDLATPGGKNAFWNFEESIQPEMLIMPMVAGIHEASCHGSEMGLLHGQAGVPGYIGHEIPLSASAPRHQTIVFPWSGPPCFGSDGSGGAGSSAQSHGKRCRTAGRSPRAPGCCHSRGSCSTLRSRRIGSQSAFVGVRRRARRTH